MNETTATRYQRLKRRTHAIALASGGAMLAILACSPLSRVLAGWTGRSLPVFVSVIVLLWELVALPAGLYFGLIVDRRVARKDTTVEGVIGVHVQAGGVGLLGALVAAAAVTASVRLSGRWWWLTAGLCVTFVEVLVIHLGPTLLVLAGGVHPISRAALREHLTGLTRRARVPVASIDEWRGGESRGATAFVAGLGASKRVFVSSELVRDWSDDEVAVIVAHELGHHRHHDAWHTLALDAALLSASFAGANAVLAAAGPGLGLTGPSDVAALPLIALAAGGVWLLAIPIRHAQSRRQERRADKFALALTGGADAFSAAIRRLGSRHLAEERPSRLTRWLYYRHPSVAERLAVAGRHGRPRG